MSWELVALGSGIGGAISYLCGYYTGSAMVHRHSQHELAQHIATHHFHDGMCVPRPHVTRIQRSGRIGNWFHT